MKCILCIPKQPMEVDELSDLDPGFLVDAGVDSFELPTEQPKYIRNNRNRTNVT